MTTTAETIQTNRILVCLEPVPPTISSVRPGDVFLSVGNVTEISIVWVRRTNPRPAETKRPLVMTTILNAIIISVFRVSHQMIVSKNKPF